MNSSERHAWRELTASAPGLDLEWLLADAESEILTELAEAMPPRSVALTPFVCPHGGGDIVAVDPAVLPLAQGPQYDHASHVASIYNEVCPSDNCVEVHDDAIVDGLDVHIAAASPSFVGVYVIVDATVADKLLSARDHWEAYGCPRSGRFHADILDLILEQVVEWMGLGE